jgi:hypothetical protein
MLPNVADLDDYSHFTDLKIFQTKRGYKNKNNSNSSSNTGCRGKCTLITINIPPTQQVKTLMSQLRMEKLAITLVFAL